MVNQPYAWRSIYNSNCLMPILLYFFLFIYFIKEKVIAVNSNPVQ